MTRSAQEVFGVLRQANEHWLELHEIAPRAGLTTGQVKAACRDLTRLGILRRRRDGTRLLFGVTPGAIQRIAEEATQRPREQHAAGTRREPAGVHPVDPRQAFEWQALLCLLRITPTSGGCR